VTALRVPFIDLRPGKDSTVVRAAIEGVLSRGWYVLGPELEAFEAEFAEACGARYAVGVGNGTDAIALILRALDIGAGDEVVVPAMTAAYTGLAVLMAGAQPVFADVDAERLTLDAAGCEAAMTRRTAAIIPVHLYGQPADLTALRVIANRRGIALIEDCCQAHLATCEGTPVGTIGAAAAFSFYPTKNLGALGDGGAVVTGDAALAERVRRLRHGGQTDRYHHAEAGVNSRLDEVQAAVLRARLPFVGEWTARRRALASSYRSLLDGLGVRPVPQHDPGHVYHLFPVRSTTRDALQAHLRSAGIETLIHYPVTLPRQRAFAGVTPAECPAAERAAGELLSLPLYPTLADRDVEQVAAAVGEFEKGRALA
jgi:dTDP-4-amino-4,6-dideoxygalactose transaminase